VILGWLDELGILIEKTHSNVRYDPRAHHSRWTQCCEREPWLIEFVILGWLDKLGILIEMTHSRVRHNSQVHHSRWTQRYEREPWLIFFVILRWLDELGILIENARSHVRHNSQVHHSRWTRLIKFEESRPRAPQPLDALALETHQIWWVSFTSHLNISNLTNNLNITEIDETHQIEIIR